MALKYTRKLSRSELGAETLPCEGRVMKDGGIDKFHLQRNPWAGAGAGGAAGPGHLYSGKPSEFYNPIWTGIPMEEFNPRLSEHVISGDIQAWRRKMKEKESPKEVIPIEPRPYKSFSAAPPEENYMLEYLKSDEEKKQEEKEKKEAQRKKRERPHYLNHARCKPKMKHIWPLLNYCHPCERGLNYNLFTKTLQIKRAEDEAKYRSKDPWEKPKLRRGTSPVHSYHPMQTCDDDYWPLQTKRLAKDKLEIYDRRKENLEAKKQEEEEYLAEHPPLEKEKKKWVSTNLRKKWPHHRRATRNQGSKAKNRVLPLKTTTPVTVIEPYARGAQKRAADLIPGRPHCLGITLHEKEVYSLDHIHPQTDHNAKYYPAGDLAFMPIHHQSRFQGLHSPRWRNKELYTTKRPHSTRYEGIHDVTRKADGTTFF